MACRQRGHFLGRDEARVVSSCQSGIGREGILAIYGMFRVSCLSRIRLGVIYRLVGGVEVIWFGIFPLLGSDGDPDSIQVEQLTNASKIALGLTQLKGHVTKQIDNILLR